MKNPKRIRTHPGRCDSDYSRLPVIRNCTYSNNSVIRTEIAFPLDLLTQLRQNHSRLFELVIRTFSYSNRFLFPLGPKSPSVIRIFINRRSSNENIDSLRLKHFFLQKMRFQYSCLFTLFKFFECLSGYTEPQSLNYFKKVHLVKVKLKFFL